MTSYNCILAKKVDKGRKLKLIFRVVILHLVAGFAKKRHHMFKVAVFEFGALLLPLSYARHISGSDKDAVTVDNPMEQVVDFILIGQKHTVNG